MTILGEEMLTLYRGMAEARQGGRNLEEKRALGHFAHAYAMLAITLADTDVHQQFEAIIASVHAEIMEMIQCAPMLAKAA